MSVVIDIAAQFTGKRAFAQAENAADKLGRTVKHALIGVGVTAFAKSAITAFAQNEKQMQLFANSLSNIGFEFAIKDSKAFLNTLELQYGVVGEQLIPAYQQLLTTTRSLAATQNLTNVALDIAARQGISVSQAADALSKAYLGNTKAVGALGLGISKATLASGDFAAILKEIATITKGSAAQGADTLSGKMARLSIAAGKARESIGAGLVEGLMRVTKSQDIEQLQAKIIAFGESTAKTMAALGTVISDNITAIKIFGAAFLAGLAITKVAAFITALQAITKAITILRNSAIAAAIAEMFMLNPFGGAAMAAIMLGTIYGIIKGVDLLIDKADEATKGLAGIKSGVESLGIGGDQGGAAKFAEGASARAAKDSKDAAAAQLKATKAQTKAIQDQAKLKKSQGIMDVDQANILAALQGKITENDKIRLQLQLALLTGNAKEADRLSNALLLAQAQTTGLASFIASLPKALNPFADYPAYILMALAELDKLKKAQEGLVVPPRTTAEVAAINDVVIKNVYGKMDRFETGYSNAMPSSVATQNAPIVNVQVQIGDQNITDFVTNAQVNNSASGIQSKINRLSLID